MESEIGKGTVFKVELPAFDALFLIVDDNEAHRKIIKETIEGICRADFVEAENGEDALIKLAQITPNAIITDLNMPVMDGFTFIQNVRKRREFDSVPILATTSIDVSPAAETGVQTNAPDHKADYFFIKPVVNTDLSAIVKKVLTSMSIPVRQETGGEKI